VILPRTKTERSPSRSRRVAAPIDKARNGSDHAAMKLTLYVNGASHAVDVDPATPLLYVLSDDLALNGPKFGCGLGQCGACTIIAKGRALRSCVTPVGTIAGAEITTLEGLGAPDHPHPIQRAFIAEQAAQCGFCLSGVILTAKAFLDQNPKASDAEIQRAMSGVLCRCFSHNRMLRAISRYREEA
jgi:nicotinate dehydrogenase subunit A